MIQFFSDNIDQLDLALDQLAISDRNFDRFALMLIDNVVELTLHRYIQEKGRENDVLWGGEEPKYDPKTIQKGLSQNFDDKVKASRKLGLLNDSLCESILYLHSFRNTSYHQGQRHEGILHSLAFFYFICACETLKAYQPRSWYRSSSDKVSYRAKKYLGQSSSSYHEEAFQSVYCRLIEVASDMNNTLATDLAEDMRSTIAEADDSIQFLSDNGPGKKSRDEVIIESQAWDLAITDEAKRLAYDGGYAATSLIGLVDWLIENHNWPIKGDPIPSWISRLNSLSRERNNHKALKKYCDFLKQTENIRSIIDESAVQLDGHIQQQIDEMRGK